MPVVAAVLTEGYNQLALSFIVGISVKRCTVRVALLLATLAFSVAALPSPPSWAYRDYFTPEQKALLDKIQTLRIETNALTDKGAVDPAPITELVARRMGELGYTVVGEANKPHDVVIKVKCEERKIWEGTTAVRRRCGFARCPVSALERPRLSDDLSPRYPEGQMAERSPNRV